MEGPLSALSWQEWQFIDISLRIKKYSVQKAGCQIANFIIGFEAHQSERPKWAFLIKKNVIVSVDVYINFPHFHLLPEPQGQFKLPTHSFSERKSNEEPCFSPNTLDTWIRLKH